MIPINNSQKNYLFILAILEDYATRSKFIQYVKGSNVRFGTGSKDKINEVIKETPYMWVEDRGNVMVFNDQHKCVSIEHNIRVYIADKEHINEDNQDSAANNTKEELFAMVAELTNHPYYVQNRMRLSGDVSVETEYEMDDDMVVRSYADITIVVPFQYTYCSNPTDAIPLYTNETISYFNSATVSICSIVAQCGQMGPTGPTGSMGVDGATGPTGPVGATGVWVEGGSYTFSTIYATSSILTGTLSSCAGIYTSHIYNCSDSNWFMISGDTQGAIGPYLILDPASRILSLNADELGITYNQLYSDIASLYFSNRMVANMSDISLVDNAGSTYINLNANAINIFGQVNGGSYRYTNLADGVSSTDAINLGQLNATMSNYLPLSGGTLTGSLTGRIVPRVLSFTSSATPTINTDLYDAVTITALATNITSFTTNLSGTPNNFDRLTIRIKDNGATMSIAWGASFEARGVALPTKTIPSKVLTTGLIWDSTTSKWGCVASAQEI